MSDSDEIRGEGTADKAKGNVKEGLGKLRDDESQEAEGKADQAKGGLKEKFAGARDKVNEAIDKAKNSEKSS